MNETLTIEMDIEPNTIILEDYYIAISNLTIHVVCDILRTLCHLNKQQDIMLVMVI